MTRSHPARGGCDEPVVEGRAVGGETAAVVVGTLDSSLHIERVSGEARNLLDRPLDMMIGESILTLIVEEDVPAFLVAYADASASQQGVTVELRLATTSGRRGSQAVLCDVFVVPLRPSPGCAFVLRAVTAMATLRGVTVHSVPGVGRLTDRERQIVSRLLDGHRPPGIARALFLSQSTVRNHLASVFRKLGVTSQEGLLELFRAAAAGMDDTAQSEQQQVSRIS
jgi:DNA-binding CsgD family transcriptional regulator